MSLYTKRLHRERAEGCRLLYGNGVTKNFLNILEGEVDRSQRKILRLAITSVLVILLALPFFQPDLLEGVGAVIAFLVGAMVLGAAYAHALTIRRYNESIRTNWNKWMRYSVSCATVGECYRKVHAKGRRMGTFMTVAFLLLLVLAHLVLALMALNGPLGFVTTLPVFALDAKLIGFFMGKRAIERRWYKKFIASVNELLREGSLGVWGVY